MNKAQTELHKALHYLDRGRLESGELSLKQAMEAADAAGDSTTYIRVAVCYGDLLWEMERYGESERWLQLALDRFACSKQSDTDALNVEMNRAKELIDI
ncbi:hypothetical protein [Paenibacillus sp. J2TS4]|uniref:hypothetical protein n=1 Tax=Paenibacillus sp. J2TS4 TaxID=2807194 RepID=UPI001B10AA42|nr:hypothetical protein [Paenibacillus sp. J2TS4]GIP36508.1 hypothetical protein J2TS4_57180 [Paenibacillus sp. J2TS4]